MGSHFFHFLTPDFRLMRFSSSERIANVGQHAAPKYDASPQEDSRRGHYFGDGWRLISLAEGPRLIERKIEDVDSCEQQKNDFPIEGNVLCVLGGSGNKKHHARDHINGKPKEAPRQEPTQGRELNILQEAQDPQIDHEDASHQED